MKSFTFLFAIVSSTILFTSCSKDKNVMEPPVVAPKSNLIAAIKFNGNSWDSAGNINLNGVFGTPTLVDDRAGNPQRALFLDGSSKLEYIGAPIKGDKISMTAWVKFYQKGMVRFFVNAIDPVKGGISLNQYDETLAGSVSVPGTSTVYGEPLDNGWHHMAVTFDGTNITLYVDGVLMESIPNPGTIGDVNRTLVIGAFNGSFWKGTLDDLRIYSTALTAQQVKEVFALQP